MARLSRLIPVAFIACLFGAQCKTVIVTVPKDEMDGLWVSNDLYLKQEGHPATEDADEDLPNIRIKGDRFWMMDYSSAFDGSVEEINGQVFLRPLHFDGQTPEELTKRLGKQDAGETMKPEEVSYDPEAQTLAVHLQVDYSKAAGTEAGPRDYKLMFRRLGSGSVGPNSVTAPEEKALVGNWYGQVPPWITLPEKTEKDRAIEASWEAIEKTQGLCLNNDHTYALVARELITGTWTATANQLLLHPLKGSSKDPFAPVVPMAIDPNRKRIELEDAKGKAILIFTRE